MMAKGCSAWCSKVLLITLNSIVMLLGVIVITFGFLVIGNANDIKSVVKTSFSPPLVLIVSGFLIFFIGFIGCFGAIKESFCMLILFSTVIFFVVIAEILAAVFVYKFRAEIKSDVVKGMENMIAEYNHDNVTKVLVDEFQELFKCCGANSSDEWIKSLDQYPKSCCNSESLVNGTCVKPFKKSCSIAVETVVGKTAIILVLVVMTVALLQWLSLVMACMLAHEARKPRYEYI